MTSRTSTRRLAALVAAILVTAALSTAARAARDPFLVPISARVTGFGPFAEVSHGRLTAPAS
jgi:hypothetical protein